MRNPTKHLQELFNAMVNRLPVKVKGEKYEGNLIIQCINLDGEIDLYSLDYKEVVYYGLSKEGVEIK